MQADAPGYTLITESQPLPKIYGDLNRIQKVLVILLSNAIKNFNKMDKVIIRSKIGKDHAQVVIRDFGIGISNNMEDNIFKRFTRTRASKDTFAVLVNGVQYFKRAHQSVQWNYLIK